MCGTISDNDSFVSLLFRYINKSAIHRLILNPDNNFPAQFRTVTILFVSLGDIKPWTPEGLAICQKAIFQVHKVTSQYEGKFCLFDHVRLV